MTSSMLNGIRAKEEYCHLLVAHMNDRAVVKREIHSFSYSFNSMNICYHAGMCQDHPHGTEMQKSKMAVWGGLTNSWTLRKERQFLGCQISPCVSGIWEMENHDESMCICSLITLEWKLMNISVQNALCCVLIYSIVSDSLRSHGLQPARLFCPWGFSRQEHWSGCHALLQGIFSTQGSNPGRPHCRWILYQLSYWGSPKMQ